MPYVDFEDIRLHYRDSGSGPVALLIHGFPLDSTMWLDQTRRLGDVRRCVSVDLRGFGQSDPVTDATLSMERHADDVAQFLAALDVPVADIVGLSMGGYVALALAERYPALLRSLVLVDTRATGDTAPGREGRDAAMAAVLADGRSRFAAGLEPALVAPEADPTVRARLRTMIEATPYETIIGALAGMRDRPDRTGLLPAIKVPTTVIVGELDTLTPPSDAAGMAERVPGAALRIIPGAGHMAPMEAPDAVADALRAHFAAVDR